MFWSRLVGFITVWAARRGLEVRAIIVYGSAAWPGYRPPDVDVAVFLPYDRGLAKDGWSIRRYEIELKAEWDAYAIEHGLPALDPLLVVGYKPLLATGLGGPAREKRG